MIFQSQNTAELSIPPRPRHLIFNHYTLMFASTTRWVQFTLILPKAYGEVLNGFVYGWKFYKLLRPQWLDDFDFNFSQLGLDNHAVIPRMKSCQTKHIIFYSTHITNKQRLRNACDRHKA